MNILFFPAVLMISGACGAWLFRKYPRTATALGAGLLCGGSASGLALLAMQYIRHERLVAGDLFLLPVLLLSLAAAIHSIGYLDGHGSERSGSYWTLFNLTTAAMLGVTQLESPLAFLLAWELMGAASFGLVIFDRHNRNFAKAGWIYMIACHAGAALLILLFFFPHTPGWLFLLALLGFGLKIGFPLLHVWLPEAHPAAPAPVSALMSGAMIELGFFGILAFAIVPEKIALYGWVFAILGVITAPAGIIFALAQSNLKKLLAYSSIENMGILSCALGLGFLGAFYQLPMMMAAGFAGAAAHILNHALFKGALFLGAGSVYKAAGTLDMDEMGGLLARMPRTGAYFILNSLSLCGLPPFSGFAGEFLIYCAAFAGLFSDSVCLIVLSTVILVILALTGGLAAAAFAKAIGAVFCGEPRSDKAANAHDVPLFMNIPILVLFILSCVLLFVLPEAIEKLIPQIMPGCEDEAVILAGRMAAVSMISFTATVLAVLTLVFRTLIVKRNGERISPTWDCGFSKPTAKMEYTGTSFSANLADFFAALLHPERKTEHPQGIFPAKAELQDETEDGGIRFFWRYIFTGFNRLADKIHALQSGSLHFYLLVIVIALLGMLLNAVLRGN